MCSFVDPEIVSMETSRLLLFTSLFTANAIAAVSLTKPIASPDLVFEEKAGEGMSADSGYPGMADNVDNPSVDDTRKFALWGTLMAGGSGVEYYFGYKLPQNDLICEDWRLPPLSLWILGYWSPQ